MDPTGSPGLQSAARAPTKVPFLLLFAVRQRMDTTMFVMPLTVELQVFSSTGKWTFHLVLL